MNVLRQIKPSRLYRLSSVRLVSGSTLTPRWTRETRETLVTPQPTLASFYRSLATTSATEEELMQKISKCINSGDVVVFMKGVPEAPRCGFSNAVCQIFRMHDVKITSYDVLSDEELRQGVKEYSKWPTYPQVFFKGELMGGCDIMLQMHQSGDLIEELEKIGLKSALAQEEEPKPEDSKK